MNDAQQKPSENENERVKGSTTLVQKIISIAPFVDRVVVIVIVTMLSTGTGRGRGIERGKRGKRQNGGKRQERRQNGG